MTLATLIIDGVLLLAMIGVSLYGNAVLPPGARVPVHFGPTGYNRWVPRTTGLVMWPAIAAIVYAILLVTAHGQQATGGPGPALGLSIAIGVMLVTQVGALSVARGRSRRGR